METNAYSHARYLQMLRISLHSIVSMQRILEERHGGKIPVEELIFLRRDLQNHHQLLGKESELYRRLPRCKEKEINQQPFLKVAV